MTHAVSGIQNLNKFQESDTLTRHDLGLNPSDMNTGKVFHLAYVQGRGKTTQTVRKAMEDGHTIALFGQRHTDLKDLVERSEGWNTESSLVRLKGRQRVCKIKDKEGRYRALDKGAKKKIICRDCEEKKNCDRECGVKTIKENERSFVAPYELIYLLSEDKLNWKPDLVIIDEDPQRIILKEENFHETSINRSIEYFENKEEEVYEFLQDLLKRIQNGIRREDEEMNGEEFYQLYKEAPVCYKILQKVNKDFSEWHSKQCLKGNLFNNPIKPLTKVLPKLEESEIDREVMVRVEGSKLRFTWGEKGTLRKIANNYPTRILSTETKTEKIDYILGEDIEVERRPQGEKKKVDMEVVQLMKPYNGNNDDRNFANYGINTLTSHRDKCNPAWYRLLGFLKEIILIETTKGEETLVLCKEDIEEDLNGYLSERGFEKGEGKDYRTEYYYNYTGANRFENCGAVLLFGGAFADPYFPKRQAKALAEKKEHVEPIRKAIVEEKSIGEMRDGIHRIRPYRNEKRRAYILTAAEVEDSSTELLDGINGNYTSALGWEDLDKMLKKEKELAAIEGTVRENEGASTNQIDNEASKYWPKDKGPGTGTTRNRLSALSGTGRIRSWEDGQATRWGSILE